MEYHQWQVESWYVAGHLPLRVPQLWWGEKDRGYDIWIIKTNKIRGFKNKIKSGA